MPEQVESQTNQDVVTENEVVELPLETSRIESVTSQPGRLDLDKAWAMAEVIKKDQEGKEGLKGFSLATLIDRVGELSQRADILKQAGEDEMAKPYIDEMNVIKQRVDIRLTEQGAIHDIQQMNATEAGYLDKVLRDRMRSLRLEQETLKQAADTIFGNGRKPDVNDRAAKLRQHAEESDAEYNRLIPILQAASKRYGEQDLEEGRHEHEASGSLGSVVNVGSVFR